MYIFFICIKNIYLYKEYTNIQIKKSLVTCCMDLPQHKLEALWSRFAWASLIYAGLINPCMPTVAFNICCPRGCVSRHNGGTSGAPLKPLRDDSALRAVSRTANVERTGRHKWVNLTRVHCISYWKLSMQTENISGIVSVRLQLLFFKLSRMSRIEYLWYKVYTI